MAIDLIRGGRIANRGFKATKTSNAYLKTLIKVQTILCSSMPSSAVEPNPSSTPSFTRDSTSPDSTDTPSQSPGLFALPPKMLLSLLRVKLSTTAASSLLLALLQMIIDYSLSPLASEFVPSSSLPKPERESSPQKANASLSINSPRSPPPERTSSSSEVPETEKPKDSSASTPVKRVPTPPPESEPREENGKELEEEDEPQNDLFYFKY